MSELDRALSDIAQMREQLARSSEFQGLGPMSLAFTGMLAFGVAAAQSLWLKNPLVRPGYFVATWFATAAVAITLIGLEAASRSRREHGSMAIPLLQAAVQHFLPAVAAGGLLTVALLSSAPQSAWMLPGLWQIVFSLGAFAMARMLPRPMFVVGVWYLISGLICLRYGPVGALGGWTMGIPFGIGQLLVAVILAAQRRGSLLGEF